MTFAAPAESIAQACHPARTVSAVLQEISKKLRDTDAGALLNGDNNTPD